MFDFCRGQTGVTQEDRLFEVHVGSELVGTREPLKVTETLHYKCPFCLWGAQHLTIIDWIWTGDSHKLRTINSKYIQATLESSDPLI